MSQVVPCSTSSTDRYRQLPRTDRRSSTHRVSFNSEISVAEGLFDTQGDLGRDLPGVLKDIESAPAQSFQFLSKVECMSASQDGVLFGLEDGELVFLHLESASVKVIETRESAHAGEVTCLNVTDDGKYAVSGSFDKLVKVWLLADMRELACLKGHTSRVQCVQFDKHGDFIVTGSKKGEIILWSMRTFEEVLVFEGHEDRVTRLLFLPDGQTFLSSSWDTTLKLWSLTDLLPLATFLGHSEYITCFCITTDGRLAVSGSEDDTIRVWDVAGRKEIATLVGHTDRVSEVAVTRDGKMAVSGAEDCLIKVWSLKTFTEVVSLVGHTSDILCLVISPDDSMCISGSQSGEIKIWSLASHLELASLLIPSNSITSVCLSSNGRHLVSGTSEGGLKIWTLLDSYANCVHRGHREAVNCVSVSQDGLWLASGAKDSTIRLWGVESMREIAVLAGHTDYVNCVSFTPDGEYIVSGSVDTTVKVWKRQGGVLIGTLTGHRDKVYCLGVTKDGKKAVTGAWDSTVKVWSLEKMGEIMTLVGHTSIIFSLAIANTDDYMASGTSTGELKVWSLQSLLEVCSLHGHSDEITSLSFPPSSPTLLSASWDRTIKLWSLVSFSLITTFTGHTAIVYSLAVTHDSKYAISASVDQTLKVWSVEERREVATLYGHRAEVNCVAVTKDGRHAVSGARDGEVIVWSLLEMRKIAMFNDHTDRVHCLAITPDDSRVLTGSFDHTVHSYDLTAHTFQVSTFIHLLVPIRISALFAANIGKLKKGVITQRETFGYRVLPQNFNSLHVCAYYNSAQACEWYLNSGTPALRGAFGSPLTVALKRNTIKCIDVILTFLKSVCKKESGWVFFRSFIEDLPLLLACNSPLVARLFKELLSVPKQENLPQFIVPLEKPPIVRMIKSRFIEMREFARHEECVLVEADAVLVEFFISLFRWNFTPGSRDSLNFLRALWKCKNRKVLTTDFVSTLVEKKWSGFFPLTLALTALYALLVLNLVAIEFDYWTESVLAALFAGVNCLFLAYELLQVLGNGLSYWTNPWNSINLIRCAVCIAFSGVVIREEDDEKEEEDQNLRLVVLALCFVRGFTYFRTFTMTRMFVYMTIEVVKEVYSFLLIIAYSVMCFGILASELSKDDGFSVSWTIAFDLLVGSFDNSQFNVLQWIVFICANVLNVVVLLNLLVSILGDAYDRAQMSLKENDLHQMLGLVIEYESIMFWRREAGEGTVMVRCNVEIDKLDDDEWDGRINKISQSVKEENKAFVSKLTTNFRDSFSELTNKVSSVHEAVSKVRKDVPLLQEDVNLQLGEIRQKIAAMEGKMDRVLGALAGKRG